MHAAFGDEWINAHTCSITLEMVYCSRREEWASEEGREKRDRSGDKRTQM